MKINHSDIFYSTFRLPPATLICLFLPAVIAWICFFAVVVSPARAGVTVQPIDEAVVQKFKLNAIPLLLIVKDGAIVERIPGRRLEKFLDEKIQELLTNDE